MVRRNLIVGDKNKSDHANTAALQKQEAIVSKPIERQMILNIITTFFNDPVKAEKWMTTDNPMLGDISPDLMLQIGRGEKLLRWIEVQLAENEAPKDH